ncbi:MAG: hypothetical protein K6A72_09925 [Lachnospiraceae bacterium]|nr:hypothetical protein [Lachnospiraceae bacterium]
MVFWAFIGIICGLALGIGLAFNMVIKSVKESNDMGDSKGSMRDFRASINMLNAEDNLNKLPPYIR